MPRTLELTQGYVTMIDDEDYERVSRFSWCYSCGYAMRKENGRTLYLHQFVMPGHEMLDHIDQDKLNNQKANLRPTDKSLNALNAKNTIGYTVTPIGKYRALLSIRGKRYDKVFNTPEEALAWRAKKKAEVLNA